MALWGGVLAPLTPRFSVRQLARELDLPVVVVLPPVGRLAGYGLAALDAVRGGGLAAAAAVIPDWPDPPSRVLIDERALLAELSGLPVETLGRGGSAAGWGVEGWLGAGDAAAAAMSEVAATPVARVALEPYRAWDGVAPGDPRDTPRPRIMATMLEIVAAEGPLTAARAYALYARAAGGRKLTSVARAPLSSAVHWLAREGKVTLRRKDDVPWQGDEIIRLPDTPEVRLRELGPRTLEEVPLDEIAALVRGLGGPPPAGADRTPVKRAVLTRYGLVRLTTRADAYLDRALDLAAGAT